MAFRTMYPPQKDSPSTFLLGDISAVDTLMTVSSAAALPQTLPYPLTIGIDKTLTETVMVTAQNLGNNQLTVTRGTPAYAWAAGSKVARVLTAKDFKDLQDNIADVATDMTAAQGTIATHGSDISGLKTTVGGPTSGLVKGLADEITRATGAENAEVTRATNAETNLNTIKVNRSELAQVITDWVYSADGTKVEVQITRYNASTQQTTQYTRTLPVASDEAMGVMTPESYTEIGSLRDDVNALINLGGRFIGVSFATKAALNGYSVPASVKTKDFTYVLDDETKNGATTRYVWNGSTWEFTFVIEHDPVGLATSSTPGLVKSDSGSTDGKVFVEIDGTMSVIGWNSVFNADNHVSGTTNKVFTATEQTKLDGIAAGAEKNVNADFNATSGDAQILNLPSTFPPSVHGHDIADVNDLSASLSNKMAIVGTFDGDGDLNTALEFNHWYAVLSSTGVNNLPTGNADIDNNAALYVYGQGGDALLQMYISGQSSKIYTRRYCSWKTPQWSAWVQLSTATDLVTKQDVSTAINTGNIGSQNVAYASYARYATSDTEAGTLGLRNEYFAAVDTTPPYNGNICWKYG